jgi:murein DD-endopeptidase MepM/ murein hydrolase activator NlpD
LNPIPPFVVTHPYGTPGPYAAGFHTGDDYSTHGQVGVPVYATHRGRVVLLHPLDIGDYGIYVATLGPLRRVQVRYCHLSHATAYLGEWVRAGQLLGYSGNTGRSTGPHLHYEERVAPFGYSDSRKPRFNG